jgi:hypothetical protein
VGQFARDTIPQLGSRDYGWSANGWDFLLDPPPGAHHGPIKTDPAYPYTTQIQNGARVFDPLQVPIVDTKDPILKPWAAKAMQATNDELHNGKRKLPFVAGALLAVACRGNTVPRTRLFPANAQSGGWSGSAITSLAGSISPTSIRRM